MRSRKEVERLQMGPINEAWNSKVIVELLLDIRDLLTQKDEQTK